MTRIRQPAVAGSFYPAEPAPLRRMVSDFLSHATVLGPAPKALIAPHAGFVYSGPIAGTAYAQLAEVRAAISRVVLLGPSHRVPFAGLAVTGADFYLTPLGPVPVDRATLDSLLELPQVHLLEQAHAFEHSLEVHLPFLQAVLEAFSLVPLVVGDADAGEVAEVLDRVWDGPETLVVVSSDLSHYHDYATARGLDRETATRIESLARDPIDGAHACGCHPINGLLAAARKRGLQGHLLDLRNSGDTAGSRDRVVGYGAFAFR